MLGIRKEEEEGSSFSYLMDTKSEPGLVCQARGEAPRMQAEADGVLPFRRCAQQDRQEADHAAAELIDVLMGGMQTALGDTEEGTTHSPQGSLRRLWQLGDPTRKTGGAGVGSRESSRQ